MKVLVVTPYYHPYVGGLEVYARQLNISLKQLQGMEIVVVTSGEQKGVWTSRVDGMKIYRLGRWFKLSNTPFNPLWTHQIKQIVARERPDVILAHAPVPSMAAAASRAKGKTPFIVVFHAATVYKKGAVLFNVVAWVYQLLGRRLLQRADRIFAVSDFVKDNLHPKLQLKATVVPNSVWEHEIVARPQHDSSNFIFIGSLNKSHAWKGLAHILDAVAQYKRDNNTDITLTVLGDGDLRNAYEKQAEQLGIKSSVEFRGLTTGKAKLKAIENARALIVYPTTANDAFPTVMLEAWAHYTPVIAAATGPLPSLIHDGAYGLLAAPGNSEALAEVLRRAMTLSKKERARSASSAAEQTRQKYTWERQAQVVRKLIGEVL